CLTGAVCSRTTNCSRQASQLGSNLLENTLPVAEDLLSKQPGRRIPGGVGPSGPPAPVAADREQDPHRPAQGPGKVSDRRVARDDEVEMVHDRRRVDEGGVLVQA